jgi:hypothetical protein
MLKLRYRFASLLVIEIAHEVTHQTGVEVPATGGNESGDARVVAGEGECGGRARRGAKSADPRRLD